MCVPLRDQSGKVRYYLGAQLDITDLVNECTGLRSFERLIRRHDNHGKLVKSDDNPVETLQGDEFEQLSGAFNPKELETLLQLRQRQQSEAEEISFSANHDKQREDRTATKAPLPDLDDTLQLNSEGSAPVLGYYKTVCAKSLTIPTLHTEFRAVSISQAVSIASHIVRFSGLANPRHPSVAIDESCWW